MKKEHGFTLVEVLVVSAILFTVGVMVVQLFFSSLKGSIKSTTLAIVKQEGDYALTVMERMIRNSREVTGGCTLSPPTTFSTYLDIRNPDDNTTTFSCAGTRIASASATPPLTQYLTSESVAVSCSGPGQLFDCQQFNEGKIGINFTVSQNLPGVTPRVEETAQMNFKTTVTLRNR